MGEDVAAVELGGAELLVAHGDPITLGGDKPGAAAVLVNVNDIAAAGAEPRWLLATVLLPPGTTPSQALGLLDELADAAARAGVTVAGGHTEVTDAVARPVVSLAAFGTIGRAELKDKRSARAGDRVLLTKELAMEGAALLAEELGERLRTLGMSADELVACRALQERASILPEARVARGFGGVHAMHDVTEGGLSTALQELAAATGRGVLVHRDRVPVSRGTRRICELLGADALGLIASGSLLICCDPIGGAGAARRARGRRRARRRHRRAHGGGRRGRRAGARPPGALALLRSPTRPRGSWSRSGRGRRAEPAGRRPVKRGRMRGRSAAGGSVALRGP